MSRKRVPIPEIKWQTRYLAGRIPEDVKDISVWAADNLSDDEWQRMKSAYRQHCYHKRTQNRRRLTEEEMYTVAPDWKHLETFLSKQLPPAHLDNFFLRLTEKLERVGARKGRRSTEELKALWQESREAVVFIADCKAGPECSFRTPETEFVGGQVFMDAKVVKRTEKQIWVVVRYEADPSRYTDDTGHRFDLYRTLLTKVNNQDINREGNKSHRVFTSKEVYERFFKRWKHAEQDMFYGWDYFKSSIKRPEYFNVLGLEYGASLDEIKTAYRRLAMKYHPDRPGGDQDKFVRVKAAYEGLVAGC